MIAAAALSLAAANRHAAPSDSTSLISRYPGGIDSLGRSFIIVDGDTLHTSFIPNPEEPKHRGPLTPEDYAEVAEILGVEPAAIRAIVDIEAGKPNNGFYTEGKPIINFDLVVFRRAAARRGINLAKHTGSPALLPVNRKKYGGQQAAQYARLEAAMKIDSVAAIESTFWGMFQLGGFNWKTCGLSSPQEFVDMMSRSEYDQLLLFAALLQNHGMLKYLRAKNWAAFARFYNGPSYAARGYHTRMAAAYRKYSRTM